MRSIIVIIILLLGLISSASADTSIFYIENNSMEGTLSCWGDDEPYEESWSDLRNCNVEGVSVGWEPDVGYSWGYLAGVHSGFNSSLYESNNRGYLSWDTSSLPDISGIYSAKIGVYGNTHYTLLGNTTFNFFHYTGTIPPIDSEDSPYHNVGNFPLTADVNVSQFVNGQYNNLTLNNLGLSNISKTGVTAIIGMTGFDFTDTEPTWAGGSATLATMRSPSYGKPAYLEVNYVSTPIVSFTPSTSFSTYPDQLVNFVSTSTGGNLTYNWSFKNTTGNNTWIVFSQSQSASTVFNEGNWEVNLTISNEIGTNTSNNIWINLSSCNGGAICNLKKYTTNTTDGLIWRSGENLTFTDIITGDGVSAATTYNDGYAFIRSDTGTNKYNINYRTVWMPNTSDVPDNATFTSAAFVATVRSSYTSLNATTNISIVKFTGNAINLNNYNNFENMSLANNILVTSTVPVVESNISFNFTSYGISNISKTGLSKFMTLTTWDKDLVEPVWISGGSKYSGINLWPANGIIKTPYLDMSYTLPDINPPESVHSLTNDTSIKEQITWNWVNPTEDLATINIFINGIYSQSVDNATTSMTLIDAKAPNYQIALQTCDFVDNCNATYVTQNTSPLFYTATKLNTKMSDTQNLLYIGALVIMCVSIVSVIVGYLGKK